MADLRDFSEGADVTATAEPRRVAVSFKIEESDLTLFRRVAESYERSVAAHLRWILRDEVKEHGLYR